MKKILLLFALIAIPFCFTGCATINYSIIIKPNNSASTKYSVSVEQRYKSYFNYEQFKKEFEKSAKEHGATPYIKDIKKIDDPNKVGFEVTYIDVDNINNLKLRSIFGDGLMTYNQNRKFVQCEDYFVFQKCNINALFGVDSDLKKYEKRLTKDQRNSLNYDLSIQTPFPALSSNSKTTDKLTNTYTWTLNLFKSERVQLKYIAFDYKKTGLAVLGIIVLLNLLVFISDKMKKAKLEKEMQEKI